MKLHFFFSVLCVLIFNPHTLAKAQDSFSSEIFAQCIPPIPEPIPCFNPGPEDCDALPNSSCRLDPTPAPTTTTTTTTTPPESTTPSLTTEETMSTTTDSSSDPPTTPQPIGMCECPNDENYFKECTLGCVPIPTTVEGSVCHTNQQCARVAFDDPQWVECTPYASNPNPNITYGNCRCKPDDAVQYSGKCYKVIRSIREECDEDIQCTEGVGSARCIHSVPLNFKACTCVGDSFFEPEPSGPYCYERTAQLGGSCVVDGQCERLQGFPSPGTELVKCSPVSPTMSTCQCVEGSTIEIQDQCWRLINDGAQECHHSEQCLMGNAECKVTDPDVPERKRCDCAQGFVNVENSPQVDCQPILFEENARCSHARQCLEGMGMYADCTEGFCQCRSTTRFFDSLIEPTMKCFIPRTLGAQCEYHGECGVVAGPLSECRSSTGRCECQLTMIDWEGQCYARKVIGDDCKNKNECTVPINGHAKCDEVEKKCSCEVDYVPDVGGSICRAGSGRLEISIFAFFLTYLAIKWDAFV